MVTPNTNYADVGVSQKAAKQVLLSFFGTIASATFLLVGSSAAFNVVGKQLVKTNKKRTGRKCNLCDPLFLRMISPSRISHQLLSSHNHVWDDD